MTQPGPGVDAELDRLQLLQVQQYELRAQPVTQLLQQRLPVKRALLRPQHVAVVSTKAPKEKKRKEKDPQKRTPKKGRHHRGLHDSREMAVVGGDMHSEIKKMTPAKHSQNAVNACVSRRPQNDSRFSAKKSRGNKESA